jgi:geranylgeranyl pyrophosphate synthase
VLILVRFVEAIMLFGMGVQLTDEDDASINDIVAPAYAALGLANDYFSFDREFQERESSRRDSMDLEPMTNAVWLFMQWYNMSILEAKDMVRRETVKYEDEFERKKREFLHSDPTPPEKLWRCLDGLSQMIIGNLAWSLQCPRYSPTLRYDANAGVENEFLDTKPPEVKDLRDACAKVTLEMDVWSSDGKHSHSDDNSRAGRSQEAGPCRKASDSRVSSLSLESTNDLSPSHQVVKAPFEYCASLPSKNVRSALVDAFSIWLPTPLSTVEEIKSIGHLLHNASLLLDDVQDGSGLRRGKPAAHAVFGMPETINSANFAILEAMEKVSGLQAPSFAMFSGQMRKLYIGQGQDLNWTRQKSCPTESEYLEMVDGKTGGLFHLLVGLLRCNSSAKIEGLANDQIKDLVTKLGRYFQIRDDYKNLVSSVYGSQKGFCEDFDEGKYSYPLVCALNQTEQDVSILRSILANSTKDGSLANELKQLALDQLTSFRSLERTEETLRQLHSELLAQIDQIEAQLGSKNWILRLLVKKLDVRGGES